MLKFKTTIKKFDEQGEKTGWTFIVIEAKYAQQLKPNFRQSFRVKGKLDNCTIEQKALIPMGEGDFIMPFDASLRNKLGKRKGAELIVQLAVDETPFKFSEDMLVCLEDEPRALENFKKLSGAEQKYFSKWIESAKTEPTKAKRIAQMLNAMLKGYRFGEMIRAGKRLND